MYISSASRTHVNVSSEPTIQQFWKQPSKCHPLLLFSLPWQYSQHHILVSRTLFFIPSLANHRHPSIQQTCLHPQCVCILTLYCPTKRTNSSRPSLANGSTRVAFHTHKPCVVFWNHLQSTHFPHHNNHYHTARIPFCNSPTQHRMMRRTNKDNQPTDIVVAQESSPQFRWKQ